MNHIRFDEPGILPCVILGAGAAGHAAAVWLDSYKVPFVWIARGAVGGMLRRVYNKLVNVPGQNFAHGPEISDGIEAQIEASKFDPPRALAIEKITREQEHFVLRADTGEEQIYGCPLEVGKCNSAKIGAALEVALSTAPIDDTIAVAVDGSQ